jgi:hypothetical protein
VTAEAAELIRADYELTGGAVVVAQLDVHGQDPPRIGGLLQLTAGRRRYTEATAPPPRLDFRFGDATAFRISHASGGAVRLTGPSSFVATDDTVALDVPGAGLRLVTRDLTWRPDDTLWAESAAAKAGGEGVHESPPELPSPSSRSSDRLGLLQLMIMWRLRTMRYPDLLRRWELAAAATLCGGLNAELFQVRPAALRARWAARRLQTILATEDARAYALLRQIGRPGEVDVPERPGTAAPPAPVRITVGSARRLLDEVDFDGARLRFVAVDSTRTVIHLDVRRGGRDTIVVIVLTEPLGLAPVSVTPDGLALTGRPTLEATADDITLTIPLPGGDWSPRATAGSWYVD